MLPMAISTASPWYRSTEPIITTRWLALIPTGWYPNSVSFSSDGKWAYVVNGKSPTGANPVWCYNNGPSWYPSCQTMNDYNPQMTRAGLLSFPTATLAAQLPTLTTQVASNDRFSTIENPSDAKIMAAVHKGIQHVIFIIKENRTYDQVLGDLKVGAMAIPLWSSGEALSPPISTSWRPLSLPSTTSWPPPKSAMMAGRGPLRRAPRTSSNTSTRWHTQDAPSAWIPRG